jgi:hypothetical protein
LLTVLAEEQQVAAMEEIIFKETGTLGIRRHRAARHKLHRAVHTVETPWGPVEGKLAWREGETPRFSPEYEACASVARANNISLREVYSTAMKAYQGRPA